MTSKNILRSQRRKELDARRSKSRVRLGSCLQSWGQLKEELGFTLHSELAQHLLDSYYSRICIKCSGNEKPDAEGSLATNTESLQELILLVHNHGQKCPLHLVLQSKTITKQQEENKSVHETGRTVLQSESEDYGYLSEVDMCLKYTCDGGHDFSWSPFEREKSKNESVDNSGDVSPASQKRPRRGIEQLVEPITLSQELPKVTTRQRQGRKHDVSLNKSEERSEAGSEMSAHNKNADVTVTETEQDAFHEGGNDESDVSHLSEHNNEETAVLNLTKRGNQRREDAGHKQYNERKARMLKNNCPQSLKDDMSQISGRKKRKITQKVILPCEFVGCDKIFSSRQYLNHHVKYQHLQQKTFSCSHPTCNKSFNFKKHLKEHEKLHSNQRDYICEFCARAFRTSSNLIIHRRIHTGEKPLQCEVCGFTCRQKASLNWHMRKHNAEIAYQFPCEICGRRFEKRDNVTAHRSKSHPDYSAPTLQTRFSVSSVSDPLPQTSMHHRSSPVAHVNDSTLL